MNNVVSTKEHSTRREPTRRDRFLGCIYGLAIGDAVGFKNEMVVRADVVRRGEVTDMEPRRGYVRGLYTDDTQMSLCVAEGILESTNSARMRNTSDLYWNIANRFIAWSHDTENNRAPGSTCMGSLRILEKRLDEAARSREGFSPPTLDPRLGEPKFTKNGCGSVMRTAPVALAFHGDVERIAKVSDGQGLITHRHHTSRCATQLTALLIDAMLSDRSIEEALLKLPDQLTEFDFDAQDALLRALDYARDADGSPEYDEESYGALGQGFLSHEALAGAVYAALRHEDDFESAVLLAANAGGDTDSLASICGAILGAKLGIGAIRYDWIESVENSTYLHEIADRLFEHWLAANR